MKVTVDGAKLLLQGIFLPLVQRLSEKVEYKHDRVEMVADNSASNTPSTHDENKGAEAKLAVLSLKQSYSCRYKDGGLCRNKKLLIKCLLQVVEQKMRLFENVTSEENIWSQSITNFAIIPPIKQQTKIYQQREKFVPEYTLLMTPYFFM